MTPVTLYIPCFNAEQYIASCLEASLEQSYPLQEILVIDDCSHDSTVQIAQRFPVRIIRHTVNKGLAAVRNTALASAKAGFLASLDADCVADKDWLKNLMSLFSPEIAGVGGRLIESRADTPIDVWRAVHMKQEWGEARLSSVPFLYGSNSVFRKDLLQELGGYNQLYKSNYEDIDISQRIAAQGYSLAYEPAALVYHIKNDTLLSLFDTFWNWNFSYHYQQGYYRDASQLSRKMKENIGLANRFLQEDMDQGRPQLVYLDLLLSLALCFNDLRFLLDQGRTLDNIRDPLTLYLHLIDLKLFYDFDRHAHSLKTVIPYRQRLLHNSLAMLLLAGRILWERVDNGHSLAKIVDNCFAMLMESGESSRGFLRENLLLMVQRQADWTKLFKKQHSTLDKGILSAFFLTFHKWLNTLQHDQPHFFDMLGLSQSELIKKEA